MPTPREAGFAWVLGVLACSVACRPAPVPVPVLLARPFAVPTSLPAPPSIAHDDGPRCIDPARAAFAHECPEGPVDEYPALVAAERARFAVATPTRAKKVDGRGRPDLAPRDFTAIETDYREKAERFVCRGPQGIERNEARYALARLYFEAHHWDEAATLFHENTELADDETAPYAVSLSLESLNVLGGGGRTECYDLLATRAQSYSDTFCAPPRRAKNETLCETLGAILRDVRRVTTEAMPRAGRARSSPPSGATDATFSSVDVGTVATNPSPAP